MVEVVKFADIEIGDTLMIVETTGGVVSTSQGRVTGLSTKWDEVILNGSWGIETCEVPPGELVMLRIVRPDVSE